MVVACADATQHAEHAPVLGLCCLDFAGMQTCGGSLSFVLSSKTTQSSFRGCHPAGDARTSTPSGFQVAVPKCLEISYPHTVTPPHLTLSAETNCLALLLWLPKPYKVMGGELSIQGLLLAQTKKQEIKDLELQTTKTR